ncbi:MAG: glycosyltransferase [Saprospiraceae bacterium]
MKKKLRIIVAPLNWGLGHATRSIPIIRELLRQGHEVLIASDGWALDLLKREFPDLTALELPAYDMRYPRKHLLTFLVLQAYKLIGAIVLENQTLSRYIAQYNIDAVISDNRLGCFSKKVPCAVMSHQLSIYTRPPLIGWVSTFLHRRILRRYNQIWVPDNEGPANLSGKLAHGMSLPNMRYTGPLTRMKPGQAARKYDVLAIISGPEPMRSDWEKAILSQAADLPYRFLIVQGLPDKDQASSPYPNVEMRSFLNAHDLNQAVLESEVIVSRSGYSTIMDLAVMGKKALLVATPGQPEQEYLAWYGHEKGWYYTQLQNQLDLAKGIEGARSCQGIRLEDTHETKLENFLSDWVASLN